MRAEIIDHGILGIFQEFCLVYMKHSSYSHIRVLRLDNLFVLH